MSQQIAIRSGAVIALPLEDLAGPTELTDTELDTVAGGKPGDRGMVTCFEQENGTLDCYFMKYVVQ